MRKWIFLILIVFSQLAIAGDAYNADGNVNMQTWSAWLANLRQEALSQGIRPAVFDEAFAGVYPNKKVLTLDHSQPEKRLTYIEYRGSRVNAARIALGRQAYQKHQQLLQEISDKYGVSPCVIAAIWGMETSYGHYKGNFSVIKSLATLAYDGRRTQVFRKELLIALHILNDGDVALKDFKGEWAGASGQIQFLPSSWQRYAVDYTGDGHKDIWNNLSDAFASIANYLAQNGWQAGQPWSVEVTAPENLNPDDLGLKNEKPLDQWLKLGIQPLPDEHLPSQNLEAWLIRPDGGPDFLVFKNFKVLMKYNRSIYYVGAIGYLADKICA